MENDIKVTIYCITYNHVDVISKALDSFLMQKTNFKYQILVHDDCSTDGTVDILKKYEKEYPDVFTMLYEEKNQYQQGNELYYIMEPYIKGDYVAICEGDDYWIDENKLQKQYDFMEVHKDVSICVHRANHVSYESDQSFVTPRNMNENTYVSIDDVISLGGGYFPTCSFFYRNSCEFSPRRWGAAITGDYCWIIQMAMQGKVYLMSDIMAVKIFSHPSSWAVMHSDLDKMRERRIELISALEFFNKDTNYQYDAAVKKMILKLKYQLECEINGNYKLLFTDKYYTDYFNQMTTKKKLRSVLLAYFPFLYKIYSLLLK